MIRPENVVVDPGGQLPSWPAVVESVRFSGELTRATVGVEGVGRLSVTLLNAHAARRPMRGDRVRVGWRTQDLLVFPAGASEDVDRTPR
ncbi:hypothetical protein BJF78_19470 [Pseudonocardia sp. CNS-139]|nr:hypothetical protein BJF78_19470 [Pseudonocardia sp. CNS-139]